MTNPTYEKVYPIFEGVCLAQGYGPANASTRICNCLIRSSWRWIHKNEKWEDYFVRIIMTKLYRTQDFLVHCRYFGERSAQILDRVHDLVTEWED